jgi:hypothetical protein
VLEHSGRIGVNPRRYTHHTGAGASPGPATLAAEHAGRAMSWTAMVELFVSASARVLDTPDGIRDSP